MDLKDGRRVVMTDLHGAEFGHVIGERSIENEELVEEYKRPASRG
jgi:hypothetical protein